MAINSNVLAKSQATVQAEDGSTMYATIQMRHGNEADMDKSKFVPVEIGVATDTKKAFMAFASGEVKELMFREDSEIEELLEEVRDISDQAVEAVESAEATAKQAIEDYTEQMKATIPVDYTEMVKKVDVLERTKAPAIYQTVSGESLQIQDSADAPMAGLRVFGKSVQNGTPSPESPVPIESVENPTVKVYGENLFDKSACVSRSGLTVTQNSDGSITVSGTPTGSYVNVYYKNMFLPKGTYKCSSNSEKLYLQYSYTDDEGKHQYNNSTFTLGTSRTVLFTLQTGASIEAINETVTPYLIRGSKEPASIPEYVTEQTLATQLDLHAVPVTSDGNYTDEDGQQWLADVVDFGTGKITRNLVAKTFDGSEKWKNLSIYKNVFLLEDNDFKNINSGNQNILKGVISNLFTSGTWVDVSVFRVDNCVSLQWGYGCGVIMTRFETVDEFKQFIATTNMHVVGIRDTPATEDIPESVMQAYKTLHTNTGVTNIFTDSNPQAGMEVDYVTDPKIYIDNKFSELQSSIANTNAQLLGGS